MVLWAADEEFKLSKYNETDSGIMIHIKTFIPNRVKVEQRVKFSVKSNWSLTFRIRKKIVFNEVPVLHDYDAL